MDQSKVGDPEDTMLTPFEPMECPTTGRTVTEWFEFPAYTKEQLREYVAHLYGAAEYPKKPMKEQTAEELNLAARVRGNIRGRNRRRFANGMTNEEVQWRLNEATKFVSHEKFLPPEVRERTGLEMNPLWMIETIVRSGTLSVKEQVAALKILADYTHSKAPTISHSTNTNMSPEDWLMTIAQEEYKTIDNFVEVPDPNVRVQKPAGQGKDYAYEQKLKRERLAAIEAFKQDGWNSLRRDLDEIEDAEIVEEDG